MRRRGSEKKKKCDLNEINGGIERGTERNDFGVW